MNRDSSRKTKRSNGIACCRFNIHKNEIEILLVRKRYTYHFAEFVMGNYSINDDSKILHLINRMNIEEKIDLLSLDFNRVWYRFCLIDPNTYGSITEQCKSYFDHKFYLRCKRKFDEAFLKCMPEYNRMKKLLNNSDSRDTIWELPKGKKLNVYETELNCAIREFYEETGICTNQYTILHNLGTFTMTHQSTKNIYISKYYVAVMNINTELNYRYTNPKMNYENRRQLSEISDVKWMTLSELCVYDTNKHTYKFSKSIICALKKMYRFNNIVMYNSITRTP